MASWRRSAIEIDPGIGGDSGWSTPTHTRRLGRLAAVVAGIPLEDDLGVLIEQEGAQGGIQARNNFCCERPLPPPLVRNQQGARADSFVAGVSRIFGDGRAGVPSLLCIPGAGADEKFRLVERTSTIENFGLPIPAADTAGIIGV